MSIEEKSVTFAGLPVVDYHSGVGLVLTAMPRRSFRSPDGASVWGIALEGARVVIDTGGETSAEDAPFVEMARDRYRDLIAEKLADGHVEQKDAGGTMREAIEAALRADPEAASRMALADYLVEAGVQLLEVAYRVDGTYDFADEDCSFERLQAFLSEPAVSLVPGLVVGSCWGLSDWGQGSAHVVEALVNARGRLTGLRALFLGDILREENEISWITQSDLTPLFAAFPRLEHFRARGGVELTMAPFRHDSLRSLAFEASNLSREVVRAVGACDLPALEGLELWLGTAEYGADTEVGDLAGILRGERLPSLKYLGLRNSEIAADVAAALAGAPILERLRVLNLSLGNLSDRGAEALLSNPAVGRLERLDLRHHYVSPEMIDRLKSLGVTVNAGDPEGAGSMNGREHRYVAHSE
jgi:hypothetical protein